MRRRTEILRLLEEHDTVTTADIVTRTGCTKETAKRNLRALYDAGIVTRTRVRYAYQYRLADRPAYRSSHYGLPPMRPRPAPQDPDARYHVTRLEGWRGDEPHSRAGGIPIIYTVHDRDYCDRPVAVFDERDHPRAVIRQQRAYRHAKALNEQEAAAA